MEADNYELILNSLNTVGIYVIREDDHSVLYFNKRVREIAPDAHIGMICSDMWRGSCAKCPLTDMGDKDINYSFNYDGPYHKPTDITAVRTMWEGKIPAFVISFMPHAETGEIKYEKIVKGNLTTNACEAVEIDEREKRLLPKEGFTLTMALDSFSYGGFLYNEDIERFKKFSDIENMSQEFKAGKKVIVCNYRRVTDRGIRWNTMEVMPDVNYTDDSQSVMIYVKDVHDMYHEGLEYELTNVKNEAVLRVLGGDNFGVYIVDLESGEMHCIRVSDEDREFIYSGASWKEAAEKLINLRYHPDYCKKFREAFSFDALVAESKVGKEKHEVLLERKVGDEYHYISAGAYFQENEDGIKYAILAFKDVNDNIRSEIEHTQFEQRLAAVIRASYSTMCFVDLETGGCERHMFDESGSEKTAAGDYEKYIEAAAERSIYENDKKQFLQIMSLENLRKKAAQIETSGEESVIYRIVVASKYRWIEQRIFFMRQGERIDVDIFGRDITESKEREERENRAAKEKASIINSLSGMFVTTGYIDIENNTLRRIDQSNDVTEVLSKSIEYEKGIRDFAECYIYPDDREDFVASVCLDRLAEALSDENPIIACEYRENSRNSDEWRWIRASIVLAEKDGCRPKTALYVAQDITESKQKEAQDRTVLQDALDNANFANDSKSEFLSRMSHDIRTPMNAIIGMTAIAGTHLDDRDRVADCLGKITTSGRHLLSLINDVLDLSKIESGRVDLAEGEFELSAFIDDLLSVVQSSVKSKNQELSCRLFDIKHEKLIGDVLRMQQVCTNILSNAVKYTPEGGKIEIEIHELPSEVGGYGQFEFVCRDNGIGMSEEFLRHIFEPFSREGTEKSSSVEGTGLGMAIARNIVQMMNGEISVKSKQGVGSEFTVSLFLKLGEAEQTHIEKLIDLPVLVADDDEDACEVACTILDEIGMKGEWVLSGREAVEKVVASHKAKNDYFAVILDWKMPGMDGIETAKEIRRIVGPDVPIIILSAYDWAQVEEEAKKAGINGFISKPMFKSRLVYLFKQIIDGAEDARNEEKQLKDIEKRDFSGKRILLVEDNELNREIAAEIIGMTGVSIECAVNGKEALDMFTESPEGYYDLIFMDIQMPVMDGHEATAAIRKLDRSDAESVPIIAMSANAFTTDIAASLRAGMNEHITKPLNFKELASCLDKWIGK